MVQILIPNLYKRLYALKTVDNVFEINESIQEQTVGKPWSIMSDESNSLWYIFYVFQLNFISRY